MCRAAGRNGSAQMKQQMGGGERVRCVGPLETLEEGLEGCNHAVVGSVELVPDPTSDLRLEITRKGPLRCVGWLPPAFEKVSPKALLGAVEAIEAVEAVEAF